MVEIMAKETEKKKEEERIKKERAKVNSRYGSEDAKFTEIHMYNAKGEESRIFRTGEKMILDLSYHVENKVSDAVFGFGIFRNDALWCYGTNTRIDRILILKRMENIRLFLMMLTLYQVITG